MKKYKTCLENINCSFSILFSWYNRSNVNSLYELEAIQKSIHIKKKALSLTLKNPWLEICHCHLGKIQLSVKFSHSQGLRNLIYPPTLCTAFWINWETESIWEGGAAGFLLAKAEHGWALRPVGIPTPPPPGSWVQQLDEPGIGRARTGPAGGAPRRAEGPAGRWGRFWQRTGGSETTEGMNLTPRGNKNQQALGDAKRIRASCQEKAECKGEEQAAATWHREGENPCFLEQCRKRKISRKGPRDLQQFK